jgi:hypothetical protein
VKDSNNHVQNLTQVNHISTPVLLALLGLVLLVVVISILDRRSMSTQIETVAAQAGIATGVANQAEREAQNAEREARVAMNHADLLDVDTKKTDAVVQQLIVKQAVKEAIKEK